MNLPWQVIKGTTLSLVSDYCNCLCRFFVGKLNVFAKTIFYQTYMVCARDNILVSGSPSGLWALLLLYMGLPIGMIPAITKDDSFETVWYHLIIRSIIVLWVFSISYVLDIVSLELHIFVIVPIHGQNMPYPIFLLTY